MTVKDRIKAFCRTEKTTISAFEASIGVANGYVNAISKSIGIDKINSILEKYPNLDLEWLLTGKGNMLKNRNESVATPANNYKEGIPLLPLSAMAGALTGEVSVMEYECERYVVPAFRGADFLIPVKGVSMQPTYLSGDIVACKKVPLKDIFFQWNKPYVLDTKQGPLIKRIKPGHDAAHILIVSDNKDYEPFELPTSEINAVAIVMGLIRME